MFYTHRVAMRRQQAKHKIWTVLLSRNEIIDDLANVNYIQSNANMEDDSRKQSLVQEIGEDGNRDRVVRIMDLAFGEVKSGLYKHLADAHDEDVLRTDDFKIVADYVMRLKVNLKSRDDMLEYIKNLTHEFIVARVLEDWLELHGRADEAGVWTKKAETALAKISDAVKSNVNIVQVKPLPFG